MHAVRLHEIRKPAGAADARDGRDILMPHFALLDELEIQREHREIAAAGAPRRMVGGDFLFRQALAFDSRGRAGAAVATGIAARMGYFGNGFTHNIKSFTMLRFRRFWRPAPFEDNFSFAAARISFTFHVRPSVLLMPRIRGSQ